jgi:hypothetical protein
MRAKKLRATTFMTPNNIPAFLTQRLAWLLIPIALLCACATPLKPVETQKVDEQRKFVKNYKLGEQMTVNVGDSVIKFQDYWLEISESPVVVSDKTVSVQRGSTDLTLVAGQKYPVKGKMVVDGTEFLVVVPPNENPNFYLAVLIRPDGTLHNNIALGSLRTGGLILDKNAYSVSEPSAKITRESTQKITSAKGYENFEILYTGTNANGLNLTYREFSPDGLARVAFFQNLTYEAGAKSITFKKYRIAIERASSESITFTVLADGK